MYKYSLDYDLFYIDKFYEKNINDIISIRSKLYNLINGEVNNIEYINLLFTDICYNNCVYCYNKSFNNVANSFLGSDKFFEIINKYELKNIKILRFFGGEPLIDVQKLYNFFIYVFKFLKIENVHISTSFIFKYDYYEEVIQFLNWLSMKTNVKINITVDYGNKIFTRKNNYFNKIDFYNILLEKIPYIKDNIRIQLNNYLTKIFDIDLLLEDINKFYIEKNNVNYKFDIVEYRKYVPDKYTIDKFINFIKDYYNDKIILHRKYFDNIKFIELDNNILLCFRNPYYCGYKKNMISIYSDGKISNCHYNNTNKYEDDILRICDNCKLNNICKYECVSRRNNFFSYDKHNIYCYWIKKTLEIDSNYYSKKLSNCFVSEQT